MTAAPPTEFVYVIAMASYSDPTPVCWRLVARRTAKQLIVVCGNRHVGFATRFDLNDRRLSATPEAAIEKWRADSIRGAEDREASAAALREAIKATPEVREATP